MRRTISRLWQPRRSLLQQTLWGVLALLSLLYGLALKLHTQWWRRMAQSAPVTIISVGNLTVGGNGKTPFTLFLANLFTAQGFSVGIVSRGYGRNSKATLLISEHGKALVAPELAGDEPLMLARFFTGPIAVARRRIDAVRLLLARGSLEIILLDDGFQHLRLRRALDLVLVRNSPALGNGWILPAGPLREPLSALERADVVLMVGSAFDTETENEIVGAMRPAMRIMLQPDGLTEAINGAWRSAQPPLTGRRVLAVCGIADPESFTAMLARLEVNIVRLMAFPDHYRYTDRDWEQIRLAAESAELVITTEKDLIKLERFSPQLDAVYALHLKVVVSEKDRAQLLTLASARVAAHRLLQAADPARAPDQRSI